jgi:hypothetical protein
MRGLSGEAGSGETGPPVPAGVSVTDAGPGLAPDRAADVGGARLAGQHLLAFLLFAGLSLALLGPWILNRMSSWLLAAQPQDGSIFVWMLRWWPHALAHHIDPLFTTVAWAPVGINLAWVTSVPALALAMAPITGAFGPFVAFNTVQLAAPALASWTGYLLCRRITGSFAAALMGGLCFGFSPFLISEVGQGHPNLALVWLIPLCGYLVVRLVEGSIRVAWFVPLLAVLLTVQLYLSTEIFVTMTLIGALFVLVGLALCGRAWRMRLLRATGPVAGAYAVALALGSPLLYVAFTRPRPYKLVLYGGFAHGVQNAGDFLGYVIPGRFTILGGQWGQRWGVDGNPWYLGVPLLVLLVAFLVTEWRSRRTWMLAAGLGLTLLLSLGGLLTIAGVPVLPWRLLQTIPVLRYAQPGRLIVYAFLLLAIVIALWLARPGRRWLRWALAALALLAFLPNVTSNEWARQVPVPRLLATGAYHGYVRPGEIVWLVDPVHSREMTWQAETGFSFRQAGGFFGVTPPGLRPPAEQAQLGMGSVKGATLAGIRAFLVSHRVGVVLMAEEHPWVAHFMARATGVTGVQRDGMIIFRLGARPAGRPKAGTAQR